MSATETAKPSDTILLKQYEQAWQQVEHLDSSYIQMALLYMALLGAYIANISKFASNTLPISICLALVGICITGAIWRLRRLIDQQLDIVAELEDLMGMKSRKAVTKGLGKYRTSTYLVCIVVMLTALAAFLTLTQQ